ncbi:IS1380 family transposase [Gordonia desulfuricans]|nr:IS1380 family transposase [Gordonia desulfuricans]
MRSCHTLPVKSASFDDRNLIGPAGVVPVMRLAQTCGLQELGDQWLTIPTDTGANAGRKLSAIVMGMVMGADTIDGLSIIGHGGMGTIYGHTHAPSTLGTFLRACTRGTVAQYEAIATRLLAGLIEHTHLLNPAGERVLVDLDDTINQCYGHQKQGAKYGYSGVRGINALMVTATTADRAPIILGHRLRGGSCNSVRGAADLLTRSLNTLRRAWPAGREVPVLVRGDSAFYSHDLVAAAHRAGAQVSLTVRLYSNVTTAISTIDDSAWTTITLANPTQVGTDGQLVRTAEVAEVPFDGFVGKPSTPVKPGRTRAPIPGRLIVRRVLALNPDGDSLFDVYRHHAFFTTDMTTDKVVADRVHRHHAIIEQVHADLKASAMAHMPSGKFSANAAWLACAVMAFNLTRAAATVAGGSLMRATTTTIRRALIGVPARISSSARRLSLHLPVGWPWEVEWNRLYANTVH